MDRHVTGDQYNSILEYPAEYNCFTKICESDVCFKIFIGLNRAVVKVISFQRNQTGIYESDSKRN